MPVHNWTKVDAGLFHHFHHRWIDALADALNGGSLPQDYFALVEQRIGGPIPDVLTLQVGPGAEISAQGPASLTIAANPPRTQLVQKNDADVYARKAGYLTIRHRHGDVVAVIEIVSPGNKAGRGEFRAFVEKSAELLRQGIHLLVIDLFPPGKRDQRGMHGAIWDELAEEEFEMPSGKPLTVAAYDAGPPYAAYVEFLAVGDVLPQMPLFLKPELYVLAPLESSYQSAWQVFPAALNGLL